MQSQVCCGCLLLLWVGHFGCFWLPWKPRHYCLKCFVCCVGGCGGAVAAVPDKIKGSIIEAALLEFWDFGMSAIPALERLRAAWALDSPYVCVCSTSLDAGKF